MTPYHYDYAVIGGDLRQTYLALELTKSKSAVCSFALCQPAQTNAVKTFSSLEAAVSNSSCIVCPVPFTKDGIFLNQNAIKGNLALRQFPMMVKPDQTFFAGAIPKEIQKAFSQTGVPVFDFLKDDTLACFNTVATAEGVICEAIQHSPINLSKSKCAVLGYGKCGRVITAKLKAMPCHVTAVSTSPKETAQAAVFADEALSLDQFFSKIDAYDFIFNTIPAVILTNDVLARTNPAVTILDIASEPGGVDFAAAKELSRSARKCPSLPGKYAPLSSARALYNSIKTFERRLPCL